MTDEQLRKILPLEKKSFSVKKRNGKSEPFDVTKIHKVVEFACSGITGVSASDVEMNAHLSFYNNIPSTEIHKSLINAAANLISDTTPNYQHVAGRLVHYELRKKVWGGTEPPHILDHVRKLTNLGFYDPDLPSKFSDVEWDAINSMIDHDRDFKIAYIGIKEYETKYAVRDRTLSTVEPLETPQITYILIAALIGGGDLNEPTDLSKIKSYYNNISLQNISLPTPVMGGVRTPSKQFSSCVLIECGDSLDSIGATTTSIIKYIANRAGIGVDVSSIRGLDAKVKNGTVQHTGIIPYIRLLESAVKSSSQGGIRGGAATIYAPIWHWEIEDIIVLKNNKGTQDNRVRKLDYGIQINDFFYNKVIKDEQFYLFHPNEVPGLRDAFFTSSEKFAELYDTYSKDDSIPKKMISARALFSDLITERAETGRIYIFNCDNANSHSSFLAPMKMSNLCCEIILDVQPFNSIDSSTGEIALCTLSAINVGNIRNLDDLEAICYDAVRSLDNILTYQDYMVTMAETSTMKYRPLGIGVVNLAYYLASNGCTYECENGKRLVHELIESIQYFCIKASVDLAKTRGACPGLSLTKYGQGHLPIDHYNKNIDSILSDTSLNRDWEWLRDQLTSFGIRNATLTAYMPSESSSKVIGATNGLNPLRSLIITKSNKNQVSKQVAPESHRLKNKYQYEWDMKSPRGVLEIMGIVQKFTDQAISTNTFYDPRHFEDGKIPMSVLMGDVLYANWLGLKTLYYHNTNDNRDGSDTEDSKDLVFDAETPENIEEEVCDSCTI